VWSEGTRWQRGLELSAWLTGITLICVYAMTRIGSEQARAEGVQQFKEAHAVETATAFSPHAPDQSLWSPQRIAAYASAIAQGDLAEGLLRIPSLNLEVPLYRGTGEINLNRGAGLIEGTAPLASAGNTGIAAHRDGFFRSLKDARDGDEVLVQTHEGLLRYRVTDISIVAPSDTHVLAPTPVPSLTLVTCYPFYFVGSAPRRYIVRAELIDAPAAGAQNQE
jgi:sortase A